MTSFLHRLQLIAIALIGLFACAGGNHTTCSSLSNDSLFDNGNDTIGEIINVPSVDEIATVEGCRAHRDDALRLAKWYLEQPVNMQDMAQSKVRQFLMVWMTNTDEFSFTVGDNAAMGHIELFAAYMAAMTEHAIEFKVNKTDEAMYCEVMLQVIEYYKRNKKVLGTVESMEKYLNMDGPTLRETLAEECRNYKF